MNPMVVLFAVFATAFAAPVPEPESSAPLLGAGLAGLPAAGLPAAGLGLGYAGLGLGYAGAGLGLAAAPLAAAPLAAAPIAAAPVAVAAAPAISVPAPYSTSHVAGPDAVSVHQPPPVVTKKIEYGTRPYIAAYDSTVLKPVIGDIDIAVPTALKGTVSHNAPITRITKEPFVVNEPVPVERPYNVPYEVIKNVERIVEVPTPVHVDRPYNVPVPTPVQGEPIIQRVTGPARVVHSHENRVAPAVHTGAIHAGFAGYGAGIAAAPGLAAAPALAGHAGWQ